VSADVELPVLVVDEGVLPSWAYGVGASAGVRVRRLQLLLTGILWLPETGDLGGPSFSAKYERYTGELSGCYGLSWGSFELAPCLLARLEDVAARGTGMYVTSQHAAGQWLSVGAAAKVRWSLGPWAALFVRPSVAFATFRPTFAIDGAPPASYRIPAAAVGFDLGCEWIL
jgi:hypothetical protein